MGVFLVTDRLLVSIRYQTILRLILILLAERKFYFMLRFPIICLLIKSRNKTSYSVATLLHCGASLWLCDGYECCSTCVTRYQSLLPLFYVWCNLLVVCTCTCTCIVHALLLFQLIIQIGYAMDPTADNAGQANAE